jgi:hypothetical protein
MSVTANNGVNISLCFVKHRTTKMHVVVEV